MAGVDEEGVGRRERKERVRRYVPFAFTSYMDHFSRVIKGKKGGIVFSKFWPGVDGVWKRGNETYKVLPPFVDVCLVEFGSVAG